MFADEQRLTSKISIDFGLATKYRSARESMTEKVGTIYTITSGLTGSIRPSVIWYVPCKFIQMFTFCE
jgi:hypothetical protein